MFGTGHKALLASLLAGTAGCCVAGSPTLAADATLTPLTPLSQQAPMIYASAISGDGSTIVGGSMTDSSIGVVPAKWSPDGSVVDLGSPYIEGLALGVSQDGGTIVGEGILTSFGDTLAWADRGGTFTTLPATLFSHVALAQPIATSADGSVIAGTEQATGGASQAVIWSGANWATETSLGGLMPGDYSSSNGIDAAGSTVVGIDWTPPTPGAHDTAFYWRSGTMTALPFGSFAATEAHAISADGSTIVGVAYDGPNAGHAVMWSGSGYSVETDLGSLGGDSAGPWAVSGDGSIVVGSAMLASGGSTAFRYAAGQMADLNTLLADAGVDMGTIHLSIANGVSTDGRYLLASDDNLTGYLVLYDDNPADTGGGSIGGLTTAAAQQDSADQTGRDRQAVALKQDSYTGLLTGDFDALSSSNELSAFALAGSAMAGVRGRGGDDHWTLTGGFAGGSEDAGSLDYSALTGAAALRYSFGAPADQLRPFVQVGGSLSALSGLTFTRTYANGAGTATGVGTTNGLASAAFARVGVVDRTGPMDSVELSAELGERWLSTDAYAETLSATNPFPASVAAGTDSRTVARAAASWTHSVSPAVDLTLRGAVGTVIGGESGLQLTSSGFGTFSTAVAASKWVEAGARLGYRISRNTSVDLFAMGTAGDGVPASAEIGAGLRLGF